MTLRETEFLAMTSKLDQKRKKNDKFDCGKIFANHIFRKRHIKILKNSQNSTEKRNQS